MRNFIQKYWRISLLVFALWTGLGLLYVLQAHIYDLSRGNPFNWFQNFTYRMTNYWTWAALTPLIYWLTKKFTLEQPQRFRNIFIHIGFSLLLAPLHRVAALLFNFIVFDFFGQLQQPVLAMMSVARMGIITGSLDSLVMYWTVLVIIFSLDAYRKYQQHKLISAQLETQLAQAQLQALKMQLHPHFLFNTLHAISSLMDEDKKTARSMLVRLSELLRATLENAGVQEVSLKQELDILNRYLAIEQIRFQDRLKIDYDIAPETLSARVPNLLLQPLVENAIRHGIAPQSTAGVIAIQARRNNGTLQLTVVDDGIGNTAGTIQEGVGLTNTRSRLERLYGNAQSVQIHSPQDGGWRVDIEFPFSAGEDQDA